MNYANPVNGVKTSNTLRITQNMRTSLVQLRHLLH